MLELGSKAKLYWVEIEGFRFHCCSTFIKKFKVWLLLVKRVYIILS